MREFTEWLQEMMDERRWRQKDLAKAAHLHSAVISMVLSGKRNVGDSVAVALAQAFDIPPETVFYKAGLMPPPSDWSEEREELIHLFDQLSDDDQNLVIEMARAMITKRGKKRANYVHEQNKKYTEKREGEAPPVPRYK